MLCVDLHTFNLLKQNIIVRSVQNISNQVDQIECTEEQHTSDTCEKINAPATLDIRVECWQVFLQIGFIGLRG